MHLLDAGEEPAARAVGRLHEVPYFFESHRLGVRCLAHHAGEAYGGPVLAAIAGELEAAEDAAKRAPAARLLLRRCLRLLRGPCRRRSGRRRHAALGADRATAAEATRVGIGRDERHTEKY